MSDALCAWWSDDLIHDSASDFLLSGFSPFVDGHPCLRGCRGVDLGWLRHPELVRRIAKRGVSGRRSVFYQDRIWLYAVDLDDQLQHPGTVCRGPTYWSVDDYARSGAVLSWRYERDHGH